MIVSGAFDGLYILPGAKSEPYQIADAPPGMQIAASTHALGYTGKSGTVMIALEYKSRLTPAGRTMVTIATCLIVAAMLIALAFLILDMQGYDGKKSRKVSKQDGVLPKPPPGLIEAIASGKTTLWAGAGVSAGSGYSLRTPFLSSVFQTARVESWTSTGQIEQSRKLVAEGKCEQALDNFIAADPVMRIRVHELFQATFHRFAAVNDLQLQLAKLPFQAAITTNYDCLLDRTSAPWAVHTVNVNAPASVLGPESQVFVKLYGDFAAASPPILGRRDFRAALGRNPEFLRAFGRLFTTRPVFFIGASIEGLLVDLELLEAPQPPAAVEHYCVTGVVSGNWKPAAAQLKSKYNIEVLACDAMHIQAQLKQFLAELAEGVEQRLAPAVSEAETQTVS